MKKKNRLLSLLLVFLLLFTACGAKEEAAAETPAMKPAETPAETPAEEIWIEDAVMEEAPAPEAEYKEHMNTSSQSTAGGMSVEEVQTYAEKIIYSGHVYMETTEFDEAVSALDKAVKEFGGFVQDSNINGHTYYEDGISVVKERRAFYTVRIPTDKFDAFMTLADGIGNVTNSGRTAQNVTSQYTDYEARLSSLYTQEERLLKMLEESGDLERLITLEARLSEVRYEIESIERNLRNLDQKLAFSTVTLEIQEVEIYTPTVTVQRTFGEKLADAFGSGWSRFVRRCQNFVLDLARSLPGLVLFVVIAGAGVLTFFGVRRKLRRKAQKAAEALKQKDAEE